MSDYVSVLNKASDYTEVDDFYPCIENVVIDIDDININIVSTDRNTIYRYFVPNQDKVEKMFIPVSNESAILLDKHINKSSDMLSIKVDDTKTYFSTPDMDMYETNFEGNYPNWRFVDEHFVKTSTYVFDKDLLVHALQNNIKVNEFDHCKLIFTEKDAVLCQKTLCLEDLVRKGLRLYRITVMILYAMCYVVGILV